MSFKALLRAFAGNSHGGAAPMLALAALPLFGFVGAGIDFSRAASARTSMQAALDAAALLMAKAAQNADAVQLQSDATNYFNANFQNTEVANLQTTVQALSTSGGYVVEMTASGSIKTRFMGIMGFASLALSTRAKAASSSDGLGCVLALDPNASGAMTAQGSAVTVLNGCSLYDNSDNQTAMTVGGTAKITAHSVGVVGNLTGASNITATEGIRTGIGAVPDPYASVSFPPPYLGCTQQNYNANNDATISPGVYCGGISVNAGATLSLQPGIYYLDGGNLSVNGGGTLTGSGVTLVFTSKNKNGFATATINGNATINLTAPKTGPTAGIVVFGDRKMPTNTPFKFNGGATQYLGGAIYVPKGAVDFSGGAGTGTSCTQLIANSVTFNGNSSFALNCSNYGTKPFSPLVVKLQS
jgi:Flp pilus assembly protein TadG